MDPRAADWFARRTSVAAQWPLEQVRELKQRRGARISVVVPARNEEHTVAAVVTRIREDLTGGPDQLVDELVVMDSLSTDATAERAAAAGAVVHGVDSVRPDLGVRAGKGEALWKSQFVTNGDLLVFVDADLTEWGSWFVTALVGPMLADPGVDLVKGFYDRLSDDDLPTPQGGRVTELVARPLLALRRPQLSGVVQPLAGEWAVRRSHFASLSVPVGYGVELATLLDTERLRGLDAVAQVDLGRRAHRHQSVHDLGVMATELLAVADRRAFGVEPAGEAVLDQFVRTGDGDWRTRAVPVDERPPASSVAPAPSVGPASSVSPPVVAERRAG